MMSFIFVVLLMLVSLLLTLAVGLAVGQLHRSDPAGNGLATAYTAVGMIALWITVGLMTLAACARGNPELVASVGKGVLSIADLLVFVAYVVAVPSQAAFLRLLDARRSRGVFVHVLRAGVIVSPLMFVLHSVWRTFSLTRTVVPTSVAVWGVLGVLVVVCMIPWPEALRLSRLTAKGNRASRAARDLIDVDAVRKPQTSLDHARDSAE